VFAESLVRVALSHQKSPGFTFSTCDAILNMKAKSETIGTGEINLLEGWLRYPLLGLSSIYRSLFIFLQREHRLNSWQHGTVE